MQNFQTIPLRAENSGDSDKELYDNSELLGNIENSTC